VKKILWTLNIGNYAPEICSLTYPLMKKYADKIGAEFRVIDERKFPEFPVTYEKLQLFELGRQSDWTLYVDSDAVIHPGFWDPCEHVPKDTVLHNANDFLPNRWTIDDYFRRDGRWVGSCNWFACASNWCLDLWRPLDDLTLAEAIANIHPTIHEAAQFIWRCQNKQCNYEVPTNENGELVGLCTACGQPRKRIEKQRITPDHLIDDYTLSRNIAKYGLKFTTVQAIQTKMNDRGFYLWHQYTTTLEDKIKTTKEVLHSWGLDA